MRKLWSKKVIQLNQNQNWMYNLFTSIVCIIDPCTNQLNKSETWISHESWIMKNWIYSESWRYINMRVVIGDVYCFCNCEDWQGASLLQTSSGSCQAHQLWAKPSSHCLRYWVRFGVGCTCRTRSFLGNFVSWQTLGWACQIARKWLKNLFLQSWTP